MRFKLFLFLFFTTTLCFLVNLCEAQTTQPQYFEPALMPRSPTTTAFEKYGTYQVNEFTGLPDISIPLYTIDAGGFKIPITLSYHASGIKLSEAASWAGLGWSVSPGGQITRRTMGLPDDNTYGYLDGHMRQPGTYSYGTGDGYLYLDSVAINQCDTRPDIFSYDFPGHGGKFFFDGSAGHNFVPRVIPFAPLAITHTPTNGLFNFKILDEQGNIYKFGGPGATETTTSQFGAGIPLSTISAWKLDTMISQNRRDTVTFTFQGDSPLLPTSDTELFTVTDQVYNLNPGVYSASYTSSPTYKGNDITTNEELPRQINFRNGKVVFDTVKRTDLAGAYRLKDIKVYEYNYATKAMEIQKTIVFYHSYFAGSPRLRLDSIQVLDKAGSVMQHYRFDYNTTYNMPDYLSRAQDFWGYYNGCDGTPHNPNNTMLTPQQTISYSPNSGDTPEHVIIGQANRNPDSNYMQISMLTGIHYPTGGYSTFTYQTNQYDTTGVLALAGGLRIHTISSYDGVSPVPIVKTYVYNMVYARANFYLDYAYFVNSQQHRHYYNDRGGFPNMDASCTVRSYSSSPHCDLEAWDGSIVVYPSVSEYIGTPGTDIGRTDYVFSDVRDQLSDASAAGNLVYDSYFFERGKLLSKKEFTRKADGSYQPVQLTTNTYFAFYPPRYYPNVGLVVGKRYYNEGTVGNPIPPGHATPDDADSYEPTPTYYEIYSLDDFLTSTTNHVYDTNDTTKYTTSTVNYTYGDTTYLQIAKTKHVDSKGNTHVTVNKYPFNYLSGGTTNNAVLDTMINRHMYAETIEKWDSLENVTTSINSISGAQLNQFKYGNIGSGTVVPSTISTLSVSSPVTTFTPAHVVSGVLTGDSRYVQMISFDSYDSQNNITHYTPRNARPTAILWDYLYENPVAQLKNAPVTTSSANVAYTGFETNSTGNWNYSGTPVTNLTAPTGSMVYLLSTGNITTTLLDNTRAYIVSYWSNSGAATLIYGTTNYTGTALTTINGWTYYEHQLPAVGSSVFITISGTISIDELRLYPAASQMTTYIYAPEGLTAIADTKGSISHFEYDYFQRLKNIRDFYGNIVNNYSYHTYDQTIGNDAMSHSFSRNNCPPYTTPGSLTYSVPINKYYSSTKASANAEATFDMDVNGQAKANQNCGCPVTMVNVTLSNSSGYTAYTATFSGIPPYNLPASGSAIISVPAGIYTTVTVGTSATSHTFSLTGYSNIVGHSATFNSVAVTAGSSLTLSATP
jgi:Family of unknown function (DUF5977)